MSAGTCSGVIKFIVERCCPCQLPGGQAIFHVVFYKTRQVVLITKRKIASKNLLIDFQ